jgi:hypothetical protein
MISDGHTLYLRTFIIVDVHLADQLSVKKKLQKLEHLIVEFDSEVSHTRSSMSKNSRLATRVIEIINCCMPNHQETVSDDGSVGNFERNREQYHIAPSSITYD